MISAALIYVLTDPCTGEIRYVGWTSKTLRQRLKGHLRDRHRNHRTNWIRSLRTQGQSPVIRLLQKLLTTEAPRAEQYWIKFFRESGCPLVNGTDGGEGTLGVVVSEETRRKLSIAGKGRSKSSEWRECLSASQKGRVLSAEHRAKLLPSVQSAERRALTAKLNRSRVYTEEMRKRLREAQANRAPVTDEARLAMRRAARGKAKSAQHRQNIAKGRLGLRLAEEAKEKRSLRLVERGVLIKTSTGFCLSEETRERRRLAKLERKKGP